MIISESVKRVCLAIRTSVECPTVAPLSRYYPTRRMPYDCLRWNINGRHYCPLGLCSDAVDPAPGWYKFPHLPGVTRLDMWEFAIWWDAQTNAEQAVWIVWNKDFGESHISDEISNYGSMALENPDPTHFVTPEEIRKLFEEK